jgi:hypothetical protein
MLAAAASNFFGRGPRVTIHLRDDRGNVLGVGKKKLSDETRRYLSEIGKRGSKAGASKGGRARHAKLTPERRRAIARAAALARWSKHRKQ